MSSLINLTFENLGFTVNGTLPNEEFYKIDKNINNSSNNICHAQRRCGKLNAICRFRFVHLILHPGSQ